MRRPAVASETKAYALFASDLNELPMRRINRVVLVMATFRKRPTKDGYMQNRRDLWIPGVLGVCRVVMHADYAARVRIINNRNIVH
jgi:hypothetical protein